MALEGARQNANKIIKSNDEISEDAQKRYLLDVQKIVDKNIEHVDELVSKKEKEIMTV
nr:ribosome recycling factor [Mycoplasmopsis bovis]